MDADISVVICTRNRAESLRETLNCLAGADRSGLSVEVIVVNNGGVDHTEEAAKTFAGYFPVRLIYEPRQGVFGKSHALNRALEEPDLGKIIAILDDDMTPHHDWFQGVAAICARWPDHDLFTGRSYVIWPMPPPPAIARSFPLQTWMYSIIDHGLQDKAMGNGRWFSGNHFWFRSRCLSSGIRFDDIWLTEPKFMLDMVELGFGAISGPDAIAGHRIQASLLGKHTIRERAVKVGRSNADVRLRPCRRSVKHAQLFNQHPLLGRLLCCARLLQSCLGWVTAGLHPAAMNRFVRAAVAREQFTYYLHLLRLASQMPEYRLVRSSESELSLASHGRAPRKKR